MLADGPLERKGEVRRSGIVVHFVAGLTPLPLPSVVELFLISVAPSQDVGVGR